MRGSRLNGQLTPYPCQAYTRWCNHTSVCAEASAEAWGEPHGWAYAGSLLVACGCSL